MLKFFTQLTWLFALLFLNSGCQSLYQKATPSYPTQTALADLASSLWYTPKPVPEYISQISLETSTESHIADESRYRLCVHIVQAQIWEVGDQGFDVTNHIRKTIRISLDGLLVDDEYLDVTSDLLLLTRVDENNKELGSHGGSTIICFGISHLSLDTGFHLVDIMFKDTKGKNYNYAYSFLLQTLDGGQTVIEYPEELSE
jgi:hypothetical protein